ncbi:MAG: selenide, water dikinase [Sporolactobacillus sp.]|jgi:septation ring formation regulator|nr:selenide, water dikinase [Sporolactobacillus sp.]
MLYFLIGLLLLIILVVTYGTWMRRKIYGAIDRAETRRVELLNRPVAAEISKVKQLKMAGDTEKKFEKWRKEWDAIVTSRLPTVEKQLFEAEGLVDKYHFKKAGKQTTLLQKQMDDIEQTIGKILTELNSVVESESKNREDIVPIKEAYHQIKKLMITRRSQFRQALPLLESSVKKIDEQYKKYGDETENGNYIEARNLLLGVKTAVDRVHAQIDRVPLLYEDLRKNIPEQVKELKQGSGEMRTQGYSLDHLQIDEQLENIEKQMQVLDEATGRLELDQVDEGLKGIHDQLDWLYTQLDKEVTSREQIRKVAPEVEAELDKVGRQIASLAAETNTIKESYHIDEEDLKMQLEIGRTYKKLENSYNEAGDLLTSHNGAFSIVLDRLKQIRTDIESVESLALDFAKKIKTLRKDEMAARKTIVQIRHSLFETSRMIRQSNIPGVPGTFNSALDTAKEHLQFVSSKLEAKPLNIDDVHQALKEAENDANEMRKQAKALVDTAALAEEMIRYGNRYRSDSEEIDRELDHAEQLFRNYDYRAAAEAAVRAIEIKEPKIMKRMDLYQEHQA